MRAAFSLLCRNGIYYSRLWDPQAKRYLTAQSTHTRDRREAEKIAKKRVKDFLAQEKNPRKKYKTFIEFADIFWNAEESEYVALKRISDPFGISDGYLDYNRSYINRYAKPFFMSKKLDDITASDIQSFLLYLRKKYNNLTNRTINRIISAVTKPLSEAYRLQIIDTNPVRGAFRLPEISSARGILTELEVTLLSQKPWPNPTLKTIFRVAIYLGLRLGEIRGLMESDLKKDHILVQHSFSKEMGLKYPKNRQSRIVPCPEDLLKELRTLAAQNPWNDGLVFWGDKPMIPMSDKKITEGFYRELFAIGITEEDRLTRRIVFHSLRHWANTYYRRNLPDHQLRKLIGHNDPRMTENYDHVTEADLAIIRDAQKSLCSLLGLEGRQCS